MYDKVKDFTYLISPLLFFLALAMVIYIVHLGEQSSNQAERDNPTTEYTDPRDDLPESPYEDTTWGL